MKEELEQLAKNLKSINNKLSKLEQKVDGLHEIILGIFNGIDEDDEEDEFNDEASFDDI